MNKDNQQMEKNDIPVSNNPSAASSRPLFTSHEAPEAGHEELTLQEKICRVEQLLAHAQLLDNLGARHSEPCIVSDEQRRQGRKELTLRLLFFLNVADRDNYYWLGSQIDLAEMAYEAWLQGTVCDPTGHPLPFMVIARRLFAKLHMPLPYNVYATAARARQRKGVVRDTLLNRYCYLRFTKGVADPIAREVVKLSK